MAPDPVGDPAAIRPRDHVEVRLKDTLHFTGEVTHVAPQMRLFWAVDGIGGRRIIEFEEYEVYRTRPARPSDRIPPRTEAPRAAESH